MSETSLGGTSPFEKYFSAGVKRYKSCRHAVPMGSQTEIIRNPEIIITLAFKKCCCDSREVVCDAQDTDTVLDNGLKPVAVLFRSSNDKPVSETNPIVRARLRATCLACPHFDPWSE